MEIRTVGVDVGSATCHLMISRVRMERRAQELSSRFDVVAREVIWSSPVRMTPYLDGDTIDAATVDGFVQEGYRLAGIKADEVDSGAVLLTGTALARHNARPLAELIAGRSGRFVCAAAGHHLEAVLAAHGSGAVEYSSAGGPVVNLDIGGGTTKLALAVDGEVRATAAVAAGARLIAWDSDRRVVRIEASIRPVIERLAVSVELGRELGEDAEVAICERLASAVVKQLVGHGPDDHTSLDELRLTGPLPEPSEPFAIMVSGGVAEYMDGAPGHARHGDLGPKLAAAVLAELRDVGLLWCLRPAAQKIRATVVGASQFSTQVSGSTIRLGDASLLPVHNVPVIRPTLPARDSWSRSLVAAAVRASIDERADELVGKGALAIAIRWAAPPEYQRLRVLADGLHDAIRSLDQSPELLVVTVDRDLAATLGRILVDEAGIDGPSLLCLDNIDLGALDYLDVGVPSLPANVVPVVVKSLLFDTERDPSPPLRQPTPCRDPLGALP